MIISTGTIPLPALFLSSFLLGGADKATAQPVLTEQVLELSLTAASLSALAYEANVDACATFGEAGNLTGYEHPDYDEIQFYTEEPDQVVGRSWVFRVFDSHD
jgi:hypothetical protein